MSSTPPFEEKHPGKEVVHSHDYLRDHHGNDEEVGIVNKASPLSRDLKGRHMQMIAMGKSSFPSQKAYRYHGLVLITAITSFQVELLEPVSSSVQVAPSPAVALRRSLYAT